MNFVWISPNFPTRYFKWLEALKEHGVTVLGVGDSPFNELHPRTIAALTEYYYVPDLNDFSAQVRALEYFQIKYGKIDYIESNNEWWLVSDAKLRERFNVTTGFFPGDMEKIKAKSAMKEYFERAGVKACRYTLVTNKGDRDKVLSFVKEVGYPVFVKPNAGVGANDSYALHGEEDLEAFLSRELPETYIMEEFIDGYIVSYDGICDSSSDVVFETTDFFPVPVAEMKNEKLDELYINNPISLPPCYKFDLKKFAKAGRKVVKSFGIKKRFFHIEFFVLNHDKPGLGKKNDFVALECNMRPAGGYTPDLIDFANSVSCYDIYADVICYDENRQQNDYPRYYALSISRRDCYNYVHPLHEILARYKDHLCMHGRYPDHMAEAMGNEYFFLKFEKIEDGFEANDFILAKI